MKRFLSILLAMVMVFAFTTSALADGVNLGEVIGNKPYEEVIFDAPSASAYYMLYAADDEAMTKVGQRFVRTVGAISGIRIECCGTSGTHDIQLEIKSIAGGDPIVSGTYTASNTEIKSYYIPFVSTAENVYTVTLTHPEGTEGWVNIYFEAPPSVNNIENVTE